MIQECQRNIEMLWKGFLALGVFQFYDLWIVHRSSSCFASRGYVYQFHGLEAEAADCVFVRPKEVRTTASLRTCECECERALCQLRNRMQPIETGPRKILAPRTAGGVSGEDYLRGQLSDPLPLQCRTEHLRALLLR